MHSKKINVRFASAISAAVIGFTSTVISFFDCPVYAAYGGAAWGEFFGFYSLLEGFGFGQDNSDFINSVDNWIDSLQPEEKPREDYDGEWMTDAQYWQQCQYDKFTGWLDNLVDSWSESYDAVGDVGSGGASGGGSGSFPDAAISTDGYLYRFSWKSGNYIYGDYSIKLSDSSDDFLNSCYFVYAKNNYGDYRYMLVVDGSSVVPGFMLSCPDWKQIEPRTKYDWSYSNFYAYHLLSSSQISDWQNFLSHFSMPLLRYDGYYWDLFSKINSINFNSVGVGSDGFIGPVYTYPAAQELARQNKTSTGIRLDVKTADGAPDVKAALDGAGVSTVDELAASVASGDVAMQNVFADAKVTPYVVADTTTGVVVTDLGVAADAAGVKPVALTKELTVPADLTTAATYAIQGKTWDPDMAKYRLPLFQYFPFCLPWDIYQVLNSFAADPVAPQIEIPIGKFFANKKSFDGSAVANYTETLDLGDEKFSKWFSALRLLESAGIIIGLVLISVHLIHGGR